MVAVNFVHEVACRGWSFDRYPYVHHSMTKKGGLSSLDYTCWSIGHVHSCWSSPQSWPSPPKFGEEDTHYAICTVMTCLATLLVGGRWLLSRLELNLYQCLQLFSDCLQLELHRFVVFHLMNSNRFLYHMSVSM